MKVFVFVVVVVVKKCNPNSYQLCAEMNVNGMIFIVELIFILYCRWGFSPLDEAVRFNHPACVELLKHHLHLQGKTIS